MISPFRIEVPELALDDLHDRLSRTRWGVQLPGPPWERGIPVDELRALADHWRTEYDWRAQESLLNDFPQFTTEIDGQRIHFLHVRSPRPEALPLLLLHGWPGSVVEFLDLLDPLAEDFELVVPSLPGFGFSGPTAAGWDSHRIATALAELMRRLGHDRYGAHGTDWGAFVAPDLGRVDPEHVVGVHVSAATLGFIPLGEVADEDHDEVEKRRLAMLRDFRADGHGYFEIQATRPQTLAHGLTDSPVGLLAWIGEKFHAWAHEPVDRDVLLTTVMLYWLTGTAGSAANLYWEMTHSGRWPQRSATPTGVSVFAGDVAIRRYAEQSNTITFWADHDTGGHFAALEVPELLAEDLRTFFRA
ncbi:epoxide hydrolase family protein [Pseudonocardia xishanensis]